MAAVWHGEQRRLPWGFCRPSVNPGKSGAAAKGRKWQSPPSPSLILQRAQFRLFRTARPAGKRARGSTPLAVCACGHAHIRFPEQPGAGRQPGVRQMAAQQGRPSGLAGDRREPSADRYPALPCLFRPAAPAMVFRRIRRLETGGSFSRFHLACAICSPCICWVLAAHSGV